MYLGDTELGLAPLSCFQTPPAPWLPLGAESARRISYIVLLFQVQLSEAEECCHPHPEALEGPQLQEELRAGEAPRGGCCWPHKAFELGLVAIAAGHTCAWGLAGLLRLPSLPLPFLLPKVQV